MNTADVSCTHLATIAATIAGVEPSSPGCEDCLRMGGRWVHLRMCMHCGHIGCCDNSPNRHATAHWHEHAITRSSARTSPARTGGGAIPTSLFFEVDDAPPAPSHP